MTQKEKLAKRIKDLIIKVSSLERDINPEHDGETIQDDVSSSLCYEALIHLPNRILAKVIREAKTKVKELKEQKKEMN
jgi:hypothetical protein